MAEGHAMTELTPQQKTLVEQAEAVIDATKELEEAIEAKRRESVEIMTAMREGEEKMSWAAVGRAFGVTPQAAMYATGSSVRTPKRGSRQATEED